ncbi:MAG: hypothetical protein WBD46_16790, partial [Acidobacteriaceae bacterium]
QMALSQLVYQMGVNLGEFDQFLSLMNQPPVGAGDSATDVRYWSDVEDTLIHSQWARLYRVRAVSVIAMLDPRYAEDPGASERRIAAVLRPVRRHRRRGATLETAAYHRRSGRVVGRKSSRSRRRRA